MADSFAEILSVAAPDTFANIIGKQRTTDLVQMPMGRERNLTWWEKVLDPLMYGTYAGAGLMHGLLDPKISVLQAIKDRTTYSTVIEDIFGKPGEQDKFSKATIEVVGLLADIGLDPATYLTFGGSALVKIGGRTLVRGTKALQGVRAAKTAVGATQFGELLGKTFVPDYLLKARYPDVWKLKDDMRRVAAVKAEEWGRRATLYHQEMKAFAVEHAIGFEKLRKGLTEVVEKAPKGVQQKLAAGKDVSAEIAQMATGTSIGDEAFDLIQKGLELKNEYTTALMSRGMLNEEIMQGLVEKFGIEHAQHILSRRDEFSKWFQKSLIAQAKPGSLEARTIGGTVKGIKEMRAEGRRLMRQFRRAPYQNEIDGVSREVAARWSKLPNFIEEFDKIIYLSGQDIAKATSTYDFLKGISQLEDVVLPLAKSGKTRQGFVKVAKDPFGLFKGKQIPEDLYKEIAHATSMQLNKDAVFGKLLNHYDYGLNLWKAWTLFPRPGYHFRNILGNIALNWQGGMRNPKWYNSAHKFAHALKTNALSPKQKEIYDAMVKGRLLGSGWSATISGVDEKVFESFAKNIYKPTLTNPIIRAGKHVSSLYENNARIAHVLWRLDKGDEIGDAIRSAKKYLGDWENFTAVEKKLFHRTVPFYRWMKHNFTVQFRHLFEHPGHYNNLLKFKSFVDGITGETQSHEFMADWMKNADPIHIRHDKSSGEHYYAVMRYWLPQADLLLMSSIIDNHMEALTQFTPFATTPLAQIVNRDFFFDEEIEKFPGEPSNFLGMTLRKRYIHFLRNIILLNEIDRMNPANIFGETRPGHGQMPGLERASKFFTGLRRYGYSEEMGRLWKNREFQIQMSKLRMEIRKAANRGHNAKVNRLLRMYDKKLESL